MATSDAVNITRSGAGFSERMASKTHRRFIQIIKQATRKALVIVRVKVKRKVKVRIKAAARVLIRVSVSVPVNANPRGRVNVP